MKRCLIDEKVGCRLTDQLLGQMVVSLGPRADKCLIKLMKKSMGRRPQLAYWKSCVSDVCLME